MTCNRVVILAGGKGTRLRPFTTSFPKPLVPIGDMPILEILLLQLARQGFDQITLTLGHLAELIRAYVSQNKNITNSLTIDYVDEEFPTGTAGSLAHVHGLDSTFMVMNSDVLTDLDFKQLIKAHEASGAVLTIASHHQKVKSDFGVLKAASDGYLIDYIEKPERSYEVSMGVYVYEPRVLNFIEPDIYLAFPDLVHRLLKRGEKVYMYQNEAFWLDIGRRDDYAQAQEIFEANSARFGI